MWLHLDIIDNVVPFISGEEDKMEAEALKILGTFNGKGIQNADFKISASCNRVNVKDGHLESIFVKLDQDPSLEQIEAAFEDFKGAPQLLKLPSAPANPIIVRHEKNRPQPRFDRDAGMRHERSRRQNPQRPNHDFQVHVSWDIIRFEALQAEAF